MENNMHLQEMPTADRLHAILHECAGKKDLRTGRRVHSLLISCGISSATSLGDHLVRLFMLCGSLLEANLAFTNITNPSIQTWHAIMAVHVKFQESKRAVELFFIMQQEGLIPNKSISLCILKACGSIKALKQGRIMHSELSSSGLASDLAVTSALIDMYAKCGSLDKAQELFEELPYQNVVSYNAMISAYAQHGYELLALETFQKLQEEGIKPDEVSYMSVLKACGRSGTIVQGRQIHNQVLKRGLESNLVIGSSVVDMYSKSGGLEDARKVFDELANKDVILWCTMIAGYTENGNGDMAFELFEKMQQQGVKPDKVAFSSILKACGNTGALEQARFLHDLIIRNWFESDVVVRTALIDIYAKFGSMEEAHRIFDNFGKRNVVSWGAMISGYVQLGHGISALALYEKMQQEGIRPSAIVFSCILKACGGVGALFQGMLIHRQLIRAGLESDTVIANNLIDMYAKCGVLEEARREFDRLSNHRDVMSWGPMIAGYAQNGNGNAALELFGRMQHQGVISDKVTFLGAMKACGSIGSVEKGRLIHHQIAKTELARDGLIGNTLVDMYVKCWSLKEAHKLFDNLVHPDVVSWSALIAGYAQNEQGIVALELFDKMLENGIPADRATFLSLLKACGNMGSVGPGRLAHDHIIKGGFLSDVYIGNRLVDMYARCGVFEEAHKVLSQLPTPDAVSYGSLIAGYTSHGHGHCALELFEKMQWEAIASNKVVFSRALKACGIYKAIGKGLLIHNELTKSGLEVDMDIGITLVDMYSKCGSLEEACNVFNSLPCQNLVLWGAMIAGYIQHGHGLLALLLFEKMQLEGMQPNEVILSSVLKACGIVGAIGQGQVIHDQIIKSGLELDAVIGSGLVDMYAKCGNLKEGHKVLDKLPSRDTVSWGAMIAGYAQLGNFTLVKECLQSMQQQGLRPDGSTYSCILAACSRAGQVDEGHRQFMSMMEDNAIAPTAVHFNCMVHLLGCAGHLYKAEELLQCMPVAPDIIGRTSLLAACRSYGNMHLAGQSFMQVVCMNPNIAVGYVLMSNVYANLHMQKYIDKVQEQRKSAGAWKKPGMAWIEINDNMHEFIVGGRAHSQRDTILTKLKMLKKPLKSEGHVSQLDLVLESFSEQGKQEVPQGYSESDGVFLATADLIKQPEDAFKVN